MPRCDAVLGCFALWCQQAEVVAESEAEAGAEGEAGANAAGAEAEAAEAETDEQAPIPTKRMCLAHVEVHC